MFKQVLVPILIVFGGSVCLELGVPIALGEFVAGIIGGVFLDLEAIPWVQFFSKLGLLAIMFLAGFEIDPGTLKRNLKANLSIGLTAYFVPFGVIVLSALGLGIGVKASLVLGIALSTTSLAIIYSILSESRQTRTHGGQIILGSAMLVDLLSAASLALLFIEISWSNLAFLLGLITFLVLAKQMTRRIFRRYQRDHQDFKLKYIFLILLAVDLLAAQAGIHSAIIAFILGIIFSTLYVENDELIKRLSPVVYSLLAPIFFFHAGMSVELKELTPAALTYFAFFLLVAVLSKYFATYYSFRLFAGHSKFLSQYAGIIFNYRLSFGIVAALHAYESGVIAHQLLNVILLVIIVSSGISVVGQVQRKITPATVME